MKLVTRDEAVVHMNSEVCTATEYQTGATDINIAIVKINGRYPEQDFLLNEVCKELIYIKEGEGRIVLRDSKSVELHTGDVILINPNEEYFWEGDLTMVISCNPAWYPEQHKAIK